jgi:RNA polymerase sigma factor FliA
MSPDQCTTADAEPATVEADADQGRPPHRVAQMTPEELVDAYSGLVKDTSQELIQRLHCPTDLEDLIAWGYQGLLEAHQRFDPYMEVSFASFAFYRIRGAIYDGLRSAGWAVRGTAIQLRDSIAVNDHMENASMSQAQLPRPKTFRDCVKYLDRMVGDCVTICLVQNTELELVTDAESATQRRRMERHELAEALARALTRLSDNERDVLLGYHVEEYSMTELAERLDCSKSWVSRINARAIDKLRKYLFEEGDDWELYMTRV